MFYQMTEILVGLDQVDGLALLDIFQSEDSLDDMMVAENKK